MDERDEILVKLKEAVDKFVSNEKSHQLIPEVKTNLGYSLSNAKDINDVAAIPGRLTVAFNRVIYCLPPSFGASDHIARVILTSMKYDREKRSAINLKYYQEIVDNLPRDQVFIFNRREEPAEQKTKERKTMNYMVELAYNALRKIPNYIVDLGDFGKEPGIFVIDIDPMKVVEKSLKLLDFLNN
ncbi:phosphomethylpyrimidine kinase [Sulfolobus acidocaldarius SUSAZ]|nr:phosphomethylpyrimidine kinase [Sulfolobus acidocaldarius SUSAZ]